MSKTLTGNNNLKNLSNVKLMLLMLSAAILISTGGCDKRANTQETQHQDTVTTENNDIPRFAVNSPFKEEYKSPLSQKGKRLWAKSFLWEKAPELVVEKWLSDKPNTSGKYTLIEFWATWCGPCRNSVAKLNDLHRKFGKELVIIAISNQKEEDVRKFKEQTIEYYSAIDTQARMKKQLGVTGIPHVIIVEPNGYVVWEGFPLLEDYELTEEVVEKILSVGRNKKSNRFESG